MDNNIDQKNEAYEGQQIYFLAHFSIMETTCQLITQLPQTINTNENGTSYSYSTPILFYCIN